MTEKSFPKRKINHLQTAYTAVDAHTHYTNTTTSTLFESAVRGGDENGNYIQSNNNSSVKKNTISFYAFALFFSAVFFRFCFAFAVCCCCSCFCLIIKIIETSANRDVKQAVLVAGLVVSCYVFCFTLPFKSFWNCIWKEKKTKNIYLQKKRNSKKYKLKII